MHAYCVRTRIKKQPRLAGTSGVVDLIIIQHTKLNGTFKVNTLVSTHRVPREPFNCDMAVYKFSFFFLAYNLNTNKIVHFYKKKKNCFRMIYLCDFLRLKSLKL